MASSTSAPPAVPPELKPITSYLARAHELTTADPVISYWCTYFAVQQAMTLGVKSSESQNFLLELMDRLETMKAEHQENEAVTEDAAAAAYIENFGLRIFATADNEDRKGKATRATARKFLAAANFLELLTVFGETGTENRDKIKYSKWKATDIAKAFREGRTPVPGPAGGLPEETLATEDPISGVNQVTTAEEKELSKEFAALGKEADPSTPLKEEPSESLGQDESYPFPQQPTTLPSAPSAPATPESEAAPDFIDDREDPASRIETPSLPTFIDPEPATREEEIPTTTSLNSDQAFALEPTTHLPPSHQTATLPTPTSHLDATTSFPSAVFPPALPASAPKQAAVPATVPTAATVTELDPLEIAKVQKHAKWAISALNYEDFETARKELRLALNLLGG
ncbi:Vta1p [Sporobolomyces koalae]|uniref:Vta1p n=1 Tax=Sporobolomyces koalae TaxID=500713 RepID=UPI00316F80AD